jgi:hypothetical protein
MNNLIKKASDISLIKNVKSDISVLESLNELSDRHSGIFHKVTLRYFDKNKWSKIPQKIDSDFVFQSKNSIFYEAAKSFDEEKGVKFTSHLYNRTKYFCLQEIFKSKISANQLFVEEKEIDKEIFIENKQEERATFISQICDSFMERLKDWPDERAYCIFNLRYFYLNGEIMPWQTVSEKMKKIYGHELSYQGCINLHNRVAESSSHCKKEKDLLHS